MDSANIFPSLVVHKPLCLVLFIKEHIFESMILAYFAGRKELAGATGTRWPSRRWHPLPSAPPAHQGIHPHLLLPVSFFSKSVIILGIRTFYKTNNVRLKAVCLYTEH